MVNRKFPSNEFENKVIPIANNVFLLVLSEPLPVRDLRAVIDEKTGMVEVSWLPENSSTQDSYKLQYHEVETTIGGDSNTLTIDKTKVRIYFLLLPTARRTTMCLL